MNKNKFYTKSVNVNYFVIDKYLLHKLLALCVFKKKLLHFIFISFFNDSIYQSTQCLASSK